MLTVFLHHRYEKTGINNYMQRLASVIFSIGAVSDDSFALNAAKPCQDETIALPSDGDRAIRAAATLSTRPLVMISTKKA
jgi:hypothetical protein